MIRFRCYQFILLPIERMNYINKDKNHMTQEEWIKYLEESIRELRKEKENLKKEKGVLKAELHNTQLLLKAWMDDYMELEEENNNLKEKNVRLNEVYDACTLDSINRTFKIANLEMENGKLKEELEWYKKQYEHSMWEN